MAYERVQKLASRGKWTPDLSMASGFFTEDHIFKVIAMGAPYFKAVCLWPRPDGPRIRGRQFQ